MSLDSNKQTQTWKQTLGAEGANESEKTFLRKLRASFENFRERAEQVSTHLTSNLRELTVHDMSHIDALWEVADLLCPQGLISNHLRPTYLNHAKHARRLGTIAFRLPDFGSEFLIQVLSEITNKGRD